jgi:hypothetical protein
MAIDAAVPDIQHMSSRIERRIVSTCEQCIFTVAGELHLIVTNSHRSKNFIIPFQGEDGLT